MYRSGLAVVVIDLVQVLLKQFLEWGSACPSSSGASGTSGCPSSSSSTLSSGAPYVASAVSFTPVNHNYIYLSLCPSMSLSHVVVHPFPLPLFNLFPAG